MTDSHRFRAAIHYWRPERPAGFAVMDIPAEINVAT
jgi:hypothetical protein